MTGKQNKGYISLLRVAYQGNSSTASQGQRNWDTACYYLGCMPSEQAKMQSLLAETTLRALSWKHSVPCAYGVLHGLSRQRCRSNLPYFLFKKRQWPKRIHIWPDLTKESSLCTSFILHTWVFITTTATCSICDSNIIL